MPTLIDQSSITMSFSRAEAQAIYDFICGIPKQELSNEMASLGFALMVMLQGRNVTGEID